jgi:hypothetical protein
MTTQAKKPQQQPKKKHLMPILKDKESMKNIKAKPEAFEDLFKKCIRKK